jgi:hypothetical protein
MADRDDAIIKLHEDVPLFREAITFTAAKTGFNAPVIEKDYFCTVLLGDFARHGGANLIFKGGTCLAKVHVGFYRLSEDLDFAIPMPVDASRGERSRAADAIRQAVAGVSQRLPGLEVACISALEAMAEKFRAALSRRDVAIRDFDLDRAIALVVDMATRVA